MLSGKKEPEKLSPLKSSLLIHGISLFLLAFAALVTYIAPAYDYVLERKDSGLIEGITTRRILFLLPLKRVRLSDLRQIDTTVREQDINVRPGLADYDRAVLARQTEGWLYLIDGSGRSTGIMVSPVNIRDTQDRIKDFLQDSSRKRLRGWTVANWKVSAIAPGVIMLPALLLLLTHYYELLASVVLKLRKAP